MELSIGTLSSATGVPVDTLRTWERRYGFPVPINRTEGSHRRYAAETIPMVQLIVRALELGHRPSAVVGRDLVELRRLVGGSRPVPVASGPWPGPRRAVARWLELTRDMDGERLGTEFQRGLGEMAALEFLEQCMGPFLVEIGKQWAQGTLHIAQEHLASESAREFLSTQWRGWRSSPHIDQVAIVLATPPGEPHVLGLHMAAWAIARANARVVFLGANIPVADVAFAADRHAARGVALSVAEGYPGDLEREAASLKERTSRGVSLVMGGAGSRAAARFAKVMNRFSDLQDWARGLANPARHRQ
ncbi:MAG TPA: MerR family transcriptional regulator [Polyangiaceae bacterium]|nr:MerR family transcriptional regulator [Polyangiaceae bacterium]